MELGKGDQNKAASMETLSLLLLSTDLVEKISHLVSLAVPL